jgi:lipopolysaccharide/colanic/teichoic acid biosynthesis glycosyltransferase
MQRRLLQLACDLGLIFGASVSAYALRENFEVQSQGLASVMPHVWLTLIVAAPILVINGAHRSIWRLSAFGDYLRVASAAITIVFAATILGFLLNRLEGVSRSLPILQAMLMIFAMVGVRVLSRAFYLRRQRSASKSEETRFARSRDLVLVVGIGRIAELYLQTVDEYGSDRAEVIGLLGRNDRHSGRLIQHQKVLGTPEDVATVVRDLEVHGVFVNVIVLTVPFASLSDAARQSMLDVERSSAIKLDFFVERVLDSAAASGHPERISQGAIPGATTPRVTPMSSSQRLQIAELETSGRKGYFAVKRAFDIICVSVLIATTLPFMVLIALLVAIDFGLPTMFWQQRPGRYGVPFRVYKFRTMGAAHGPDGRRIADADRSTPLGEFLRRYRLDELPQLWDILRGDMSFVGPRPLLPIDQSLEHEARLLMRPGLTGWAQIKGGRAISAEDKAALDIWYVRNASLWLDFKILALTVPMLLKGESIDTESIVRARRELATLGL